MDKINYYKSLTKDKLVEIMKNLASNESARQFVMYTGLIGMYLFDYAMQGIDTVTSLNVYYLKENKGGVQLSFINKHSIFKARQKRGESAMSYYIGTNYIFSSKRLRDFEEYLINNKLLEMRKTYKIGESAVGGIVDIELNKNTYTIKFKDWNTKEVVEKGEFTDKHKAEEFLWTNTTSYYADMIINFKPLNKRR